MDVDHGHGHSHGHGIPWSCAARPSSPGQKCPSFSDAPLPPSLPPSLKLVANVERP